MLDLSTVKLDVAKLERGCWWEVHRADDGSIAGKVVDEPSADATALLIVPAGLAYERALDEAREPFLDKIRDKSIDDDTRRKIMGEALGKAVLRGWRNLTMHGKPLEWSEQQAIELLSGLAWSSFYEFVQWAASVRAAAAAKEEAAAAGN